MIPFMQEVKSKKKWWKESKCRLYQVCETSDDQGGVNVANPHKNYPPLNVVKNRDRIRHQ